MVKNQPETHRLMTLCEALHWGKYWVWLSRLGGGFFKLQNLLILTLSFALAAHSHAQHPTFTMGFFADSKDGESGWGEFTLLQSHQPQGCGPQSSSRSAFYVQNPLHTRREQGNSCAGHFQVECLSLAVGDTEYSWGWWWCWWCWWFWLFLLLAVGRVCLTTQDGTEGQTEWWVVSSEAVKLSTGSCLSLMIYHGLARTVFLKVGSAVLLTLSPAARKILGGIKRLRCNLVGFSFLT